MAFVITFRQLPEWDLTLGHERFLVHTLTCYVLSSYAYYSVLYGLSY